LQLQFSVCKSSQDLFKHPSNKNHHNYLQNPSNPFQHEICQTIKDQIIS